MKPFSCQVSIAGWKLRRRACSMMNVLLLFIMIMVVAVMIMAVAVAVGIMAVVV